MSDYEFNATELHRTRTSNARSAVPSTMVSMDDYLKVVAERDALREDLQEARRPIVEFAEATEQMRDRRNDEFARVCAREMEFARADLLTYAAKHAKGTP